MNEKPKVLIIDDEEPFLLVMTEKLSDYFQVTVAKDGQAGLERALAEHPDLILLDIVMPKMHGWDVYEKLRRDDWGKWVPVVIMTNVANKYKAEQGAKSGEFDYCVKSDYNLEEIVEKIKDKLKK
ncbi:MAG: response regulator [Patescibacteria group bacterium]